MSLRQAGHIALYACERKRIRTRDDAVEQAELKGITYYACPFSKDDYHYHLTSGRRSRSRSSIRAAAERLGTLGPMVID